MALQLIDLPINYLHGRLYERLYKRPYDVQVNFLKGRSKPPSSLQAKTWTCNKISLRLVLRKEQWLRLPRYLKVPNGLTVALAQKTRKSVMLASGRRDYLERALYNQPPAWRACTMKFREDGILLPFGSSRGEFDTPNP